MSLLSQIKTRRKSLKLTQSDMHLRAGISRQQYQQIESKGNPRLSTLELIAEGLNGQLMFIPKEKLAEVIAILSDEHEKLDDSESLINDPWQDLLDDEKSKGKVK